MDDKITKLWHWHKNLQMVLNDIREAQNALNADCVGQGGFAKLAQKVDALIIKAEKIAERLNNELNYKI